MTKSAPVDNSKPTLDGEIKKESEGSPLVNTSSRCEVVNEKLSNGLRVSRKSPSKMSRESYKLGDITDIKNTDSKSN